MSTAAVSYVVYCDGACEPNPGTGGWGAVVLTSDGTVHCRLKGGPIVGTTNNRMEILSVVEGLKALPEGVAVEVRTDSQLVINTMTKGWRRHTNQAWWARLDREVKTRKVTWAWVRGHNGDRWNEVADSLAVEGASEGCRPGKWMQA